MTKEITREQAKIESELIRNMIKHIQGKDWLYNSEEIVRWLNLWKPIYVNIKWRK